MPASEEEEFAYWDSRGTELRRSQLVTVQNAAKAWGTLLGTLLGLFGVVAFAGGITTIDKLDDPWDTVAKIVTSLAVIAAMYATATAAMASQSLTPQEAQDLDAWSLAHRSSESADVALRRLNRSRVAGIAAVGLVLGGALVILWFGQGSAAPSQKAIIVLSDGAVCGDVAVKAGVLTIDGQAISSEQASGLTLVDKCP